MDQLYKKIEKLKEIIVHVGLAGEYKPGYDIVKNLKATKCVECLRLARELEALESQQAELKPSDEDIDKWIAEQNYSNHKIMIAYKDGLRDGAKAMRDGKISPQPDNIK